VKPPPFEYLTPESLEEALDLLAEFGDEAKVIAGGQSLVPLLAMRLSRPSVLIDINALPGLRSIEERNGSVVFGATARERDAERSPVVAARLPVMAEALPYIGHISIRNRGTVGGSIAHADASAELPTVAMATGAEMLLRSRRGSRRVAADQFFLGHYTTALADDECLVEVRVPTGPVGAGWSFLEVARRPGDFALVGVAAMVSISDGCIGEARVCLMGVADRPVRAMEIEAALAGRSPSETVFSEAADGAVRRLEPPSDMHGSSEFRRHLAAVTVRRALVAAAERAIPPS
jgi:carbon-monoxide dehydrogenase medium subunit